jgi:peptide/nickel transport system substrate-binding protein
VGDLLFDSLLRVDAQTAALLPGLAREWAVSDDGQTLTFHLRPGLIWHDGRPFSAQDVRFSLSLAADSDGPSPYRYDLAPVIRVTAPDDATVTVTLDEPGCDALYAVGRVPILPRHLLSDQDLTEAAFNRRPVGTGPFVFESWAGDGTLTLAANERYWAGPPRLDRWSYRVAPDATALRGSLESGELHLIRLPAGAEAVSLPEAVQTLSFPADRWYFVALNTDHPILGDATVRRALALALDRRRLLEIALDGSGSLIDAPWLPGHWALGDDSPDPPPYAPEEARELLAQAGWRDTDGDGLREREGRLLHVGIVTNQENPVRQRIALLTQQYWRAVGVSAQVNVQPWGGLQDDLFGHAFDAAVLDWPLEPGPDQSWLWSSIESELEIGFNFVSYASAEADALLAQGREAPGCEPALRAEAYRRLAQRLAVDGPYLFLFAPHRRVAVVESLIGVRPGPYGRLYWNVVDWHLLERETP